MVGVEVPPGDVEVDVVVEGLAVIPSLVLLEHGGLEDGAVADVDLTCFFGEAETGALEVVLDGFGLGLSLFLLDKLRDEDFVIGLLLLALLALLILLLDPVDSFLGEDDVFGAFRGLLLH